MSTSEQQPASSSHHPLTHTRGRRPGRGRGLGIQSTTSFPRLSALVDPSASASAGSYQAHEKQCILRVPTKWSEVLRGRLAERRDVGMSIVFVNSRIARCTLFHDRDEDGSSTAASPEHADFVLPAVLFDLPSVLETVKAYRGDHSQYYKVADIAQALVVLESDDQRAMPAHVQHMLRQASSPSPLPAIPEYESKATDVETVFAEERAWTLWPHGLTAPMHDIRIRRRQVEPGSGRISLSASQTAETIERIVERLLAADEAAEGVRVTLRHAGREERTERVFEKGLLPTGGITTTAGVYRSHEEVGGEEEQHSSDEDLAVQLELDLSQLLPASTSGGDYFVAPALHGDGAAAPSSGGISPVTDAPSKSRLDAMIRQLTEMQDD